MVGDGLMQWQSDSHVVIVSQLHSAFFFSPLFWVSFLLCSSVFFGNFLHYYNLKIMIFMKKRFKFASFLIFKKKTHILQQVPAGSQNIKGFLIFWAFISGLEPNLAKYSC
jgi:hypothetical protein